MSANPGIRAAESYKKECQEKNLPFGSMPVDFLSPGLKRRSNRSSLWFHFAVVTAPIVFLKHNKPNRCPPDEWQHMVLSETRGLWLCPIVREGIGLNSETRARKARA